jgi:PmbA protein
VVAGEKESSVDHLLKLALELVPFGESVDYQFPTAQIYNSKSPPPIPFVENLKRKDLDEIATHYLSIAKKRLPGLNIDLSIEKSNSSLDLQGSTGLKGGYASSTLNISVQVMEFKESEIFEWNQTLPSPPHAQRDLECFFEDLYEEIEAARTPSTSLGQGEYPFIFTPEILQGGLLPSFFLALSPTLLENKTSPLVNRLGEKIFADEISFEEQAAEIPFDGDGLPTTAKTIINQGVLELFPIPLEYSKRLKSNPTANSFGGFPFSDFHFKKGSGELKKWIRSMSEGVILCTSYNLTQGNIANGNLSGIISLGLHIKDGKIQGRVKDRTCTLNLYEALGKNLHDISKRTQVLGHGRVMNLPWVLSHGIEVS